MAPSLALPTSLLYLLVHHARFILFRWWFPQRQPAFWYAVKNTYVYSNAWYDVTNSILPWLFDYYSLVVPHGGEEDPLWHDTQRETTAAVCDRGYALLEWLHVRPETEIVLSAHSSILFTLLNAVITPETPGEGLAQWFLTGEMRSVRLHVEEVKDAAAGDDDKSKKAKYC